MSRRSRHRARERLERKVKASIGRLVGFYLLAAICVLVAYGVYVWPYWLGTALAVGLFGAGQHSTAREVTGWIFEIPWLVVALPVGAMLGWDALRKWFTT